MCSCVVDLDVAERVGGVVAQLALEALDDVVRLQMTHQVTLLGRFVLAFVALEQLALLVRAHMPSQRRFRLVRLAAVHAEERLL